MIRDSLAVDDIQITYSFVMLLSAFELLTHILAGNGSLSGRSNLFTYCWK